MATTPLTEQKQKATSVENVVKSNQEVTKIAIEAVKAEIEKKTTSTLTGKARILCHTPYSAYSGHACVDVNGTTVAVYWGGNGAPPGTNGQVADTIYYEAVIDNKCGC